MCTQYGELCTILTHSSSSHFSYAIPRCIPPRTVELTLISPVWSLPTTSSSSSQQSQKNCPIQATKSCSNSTKLLYGPRTKKASSLYVRTTSKLLSTYLANGWLVAKAVVLGHFLEFSDRQQSSRPIILLPSRRSSLIVNATRRGKSFFWYQRNSLVEEDVC